MQATVEYTYALPPAQLPKKVNIIKDLRKLRTRREEEGGEGRLVKRRLEV